MERSPERGAVDCHVAVDCPAGLERGRLPLQRSLAWGRDERAAAPSAAEAETGGPRDESPFDLLTQDRGEHGQTGESHVRDWVCGLGGESETPEAQSISYGERGSFVTCTPARLVYGPRSVRVGRVGRSLAK